MTTPAEPHDVRVAIADSIAEHLKSYDVAAFCESLGAPRAHPTKTLGRICPNYP